MDNCSNSRANTCLESLTRKGTGAFIRTETNRVQRLMTSVPVTSSVDELCDNVILSRHVWRLCDRADGTLLKCLPYQSCWIEVDLPTMMYNGVYGRIRVLIP
uniref:SJCHGC07011 protein n=1 Tax=Schistosoma japonicum TaxID=6182 RepID=Q5DDG7_SCHJA|nr:SJCHGC07011 protein [Schistosoma japonicum]